MPLKKLENTEYAKFATETQIYVCVNERDDGRPACGHHRGLEMRDALKKYVKDNKIFLDAIVIRSGCLGVCPKAGVTLAVYPECQWYTEATPEDVPEIIERHLKKYVGAKA
ncbi:MAG: (2Fe-2S) ferredoxin domain-containing protein [Candidatus Methylomirabilis sp.]|nr:(2Fe-2S) ferredoxin domain-containing protein [Deltaproteobacteria bacterium]